MKTMKKATTTGKRAQQSTSNKTPAKKVSVPKKNISNKTSSLAKEHSILSHAHIKEGAHMPQIKGQKISATGPHLDKRGIASGITSPQGSILLYQDVKNLIETSLNKSFHLALETDNPSLSIEQKYDTFEIASLVDHIIRALDIDKTEKPVIDNSDYEEIAQSIIKSFIKEQNHLFKRHFPHFQLLLKEEFKSKTSLACLSIKDIEAINKKEPITKDIRGDLNKAIKLILANILAVTLILIAFKQLRAKPSTPAENLLLKTLVGLETRLNKILKKVEKIYNDLEFESRYTDEPIKGLKLAKAIKEEILRSKRFITNVCYDIQTMDTSSTQFKSIFEWVRQDLEAFLNVVNDKIEIAHLIGDKDLESKLQSLRNKLYLNLRYPNTIQVSTLPRDAHGNFQPQQLKDFLFNRFAKQLESIGHKDEHLERRVNAQYLTNADEIYTACSKIFWVPYADVKKHVDSCIQIMRSIEGLTKRIDQLSENAIRPRQSYSREIEAKLKRVPKVIEELDSAYSQAEEKAKSKNHRFDFTIQHFVRDLKESMPTEKELSQLGYLPHF